MIPVRIFLVIAAALAFASGWYCCGGEYRTSAALALAAGGVVLVAHLVHEAKRRARLIGRRYV